MRKLGGESSTPENQGGRPSLALVADDAVAPYAWPAADGRLSPAGLLAVSGYLFLASGMVDQIDALLAIAQARAGARRLAEVLRHEPPAEGTGSVTPKDGAVRLRGVTVLRAGERVLDRLDLDLPAGAAVALVGRTGAGKSVLAGLLGRLTDPDEGEIAIGGVPVRDLPLDRLRTLVAHAFERPELYGRTVHEAISFGRPGLTRADVVRAARAAQADRFVRRLPAGYDTPLDETPMSGGERQRLGLARALVCPALVHVLDDATSGLDTVTEAEVSRSVTDLLAGRTRLVAAHRAATAARCDTAWPRRPPCPKCRPSRPSRPGRPGRQGCSRRPDGTGRPRTSRCGNSTSRTARTPNACCAGSPSTFPMATTWPSSARAESASPPSPRCSPGSSPRPPVR
ncbi:ABC transporter ATP-binding protein [Streptomyces sp. ISL-43]|uniref:ATP-binding cassette domain-containing protein n=1 Tax=Streptomyces sp. ISL-43 TaxID=2819183 RepID=UPI001BE73FF8|nr:ABC transporter ATP-binding protein [Streptomyces sp. ISL-43]MBT2450200.1 ABC transporter ATP-binding protein [Streptomyces sp. ISL-43]